MNGKELCSRAKKGISHKGYFNEDKRSDDPAAAMHAVRKKRKRKIMKDSRITQSEQKKSQQDFSLPFDMMQSMTAVRYNTFVFMPVTHSGAVDWIGKVCE